MTEIREPSAAPATPFVSPDPSRSSALPATPVVDGHGLRLRVWDPESAADVDAWLRGLTDPEFLRWNTPLRKVSDAATARESLESKTADAAAGRAMTFCVTDAADGTILGQVGVSAIERVPSHAGVGYWVLPEARGRHVATRSLLLAARWAFAEIGLHRLELGHALGHDASCRIAERGGFRYEGTLRGAMWEAGRTDAFRDVHAHGRLATDPEPESP
ncbi:RimJ/RimL family protein N-acetyltransferase [Streptomyces achromogenes]|uniref:GNAT family N-acetyltransferase n=1 Tax=Streptomyces achromogenes TaxID=67255 RepID=UPI0027871F37|nr:GNAT family N-acetyltransferase [Streptomyces achromogenes]MDQ0831659.1 RimJ/RimL family protein N-acetyltransferase [Streptomyces achromogenes]